jgi:hypothetical protein
VLDKPIDELTEEELEEMKNTGLDELVEFAEGVEEMRAESRDSDE